MFVLLISQPLRYHIIDVDLFTVWVWVECIGVLSQMQRYFSHICDCTDVQADWRSCTYGRAPNAIDNLQGYLTYPSYTDKGPPFLYGEPTHRPISSPFTTRWGYGGRIFDLNTRRPHRGGGLFTELLEVFLDNLQVMWYAMIAIRGRLLFLWACTLPFGTYMYMYSFVKTSLSLTFRVSRYWFRTARSISILRFTVKFWQTNKRCPLLWTPGPVQFGICIWCTCCH